MQIYHLFQFVLGLFMLAVSAGLVLSSLYNLRSPQPIVRWWVPASVSLMMLMMGLSRVSAAFDPGYDISTRTQVLCWIGMAVALVALPFFLVSLFRLRRAKSAGGKKPAA